MACHPSSILVWVKDLSISGSNWKENFAWSCMRMGTRIINDEWWQVAKINYEGYWNDMASFHLFWLTEGITKRRAHFSLCCALLFDFGSHPLRNLCLHWNHVFTSVTMKWQRHSVCVCGSSESHNQKALSLNLFLLIIGRLLSVPSLWCFCLSILAVASPNYSFFQCYPFEIYEHKDSGLEAWGIEAQICARDLLSLF